MTGGTTEFENSQQEEEGPGTHQTGETNTTDKDQHDEGHSLEEVGTQEHSLSVMDRLFVIVRSVPMSRSDGLLVCRTVGLSS